MEFRTRARPGSARVVRERPAVRAYHGSPHEFDRFSLDAIGTGEGAQGFGWGLYFAENEKVARHYRDNVTAMLTSMVEDGDLDGAAKANAAVAFYGAKENRDAAAAFVRREMEDRIDAWSDAPKPEFYDQAQEVSRRTLRLLEDPRWKPDGRMYEVAIDAELSRLIDYNANWADQPQAVRDAFEAILLARDGATDLLHVMSRNGVSGGGAYHRLGQILGSEKAASEALRAEGISGLRYLDVNSRAGVERTRNFVIWDDSRVDILRRYGLLGPALVGGAAALGGGPGDEADAMEFRTRARPGSARPGSARVGEALDEAFADAQLRDEAFFETFDEDFGGLDDALDEMFRDTAPHAAPKRAFTRGEVNERAVRFWAARAGAVADQTAAAVERYRTLPAPDPNPEGLTTWPFQIAGHPLEMWIEEGPGATPATVTFGAAGTYNPSVRLKMSPAHQMAMFAEAIGVLARDAAATGRAGYKFEGLTARHRKLYRELMREVKINGYEMRDDGSTMYVVREGAYLPRNIERMSVKIDPSPTARTVAQVLAAAGFAGAAGFVWTDEAEAEEPPAPPADLDDDARDDLTVMGGNGADISRLDATITRRRAARAPAAMFAKPEPVEREDAPPRRYRPFAQRLQTDFDEYALVAAQNAEDRAFYYAFEIARKRLKDEHGVETDNPIDDWTDRTIVEPVRETARAVMRGGALEDGAFGSRRVLELFFEGLAGGEAVGASLTPDPGRAPRRWGGPSDPTWPARSGWYELQMFMEKREDAQQAARITAFMAEYKKHYPDADVDALLRPGWERMAEAEREKIANVEQEGFWGSLATGVPAGAAASFSDPAQAPFNFIPGGGGRTLLAKAGRSALINAGVNMGIESYINPIMQENLISAGAQEEFDEEFYNRSLAISAVFGGALGGGLTTLGHLGGGTARRARPRPPREVDPDAVKRALDAVPEEDLTAELRGLKTEMEIAEQTEAALQRDAAERAAIAEAEAREASPSETSRPIRQDEARLDSEIAALPDDHAARVSQERLRAARKEVSSLEAGRKETGRGAGRKKPDELARAEERLKEARRTYDAAREAYAAARPKAPSPDPYAPENSPFRDIEREPRAPREEFDDPAPPVIDRELADMRAARAAREEARKTARAAREAETGRAEPRPKPSEDPYRRLYVQDEDGNVKSIDFDRATGQAEREINAGVEMRKCFGGGS